MLGGPDGAPGPWELPGRAGVERPVPADEAAAAAPAGFCSAMPPASLLLPADAGPVQGGDNHDSDQQGPSHAKVMEAHTLGWRLRAVPLHNGMKKPLLYMHMLTLMLSAGWAKEQQILIYLPQPCPTQERRHSALTNVPCAGCTSAFAASARSRRLRFATASPSLVDAGAVPGPPCTGGCK